MNCDSLVVHSVVQSPHRLCYPSSDTTVGMFNFTWNFRFENTFVCFFVDTYTPSQLIGHCLWHSSWSPSDCTEFPLVALYTYVTFTVIYHSVLNIIHIHALITNLCNTYSYLEFVIEYNPYIYTLYTHTHTHTHT